MPLSLSLDPLPTRSLTPLLLPPRPHAPLSVPLIPFPLAPSPYLFPRRVTATNGCHIFPSSSFLYADVGRVHIIHYSLEQ